VFVISEHNDSFSFLKRTPVVWILALVIFCPGWGGAISINRTNTWNGNGGDFFWSNSSNWDSGSPLAGDTLQFGGSGAHASNDFPDLHISDVFFNANSGSFILEGNQLTFSGGSDLKRVRSESVSTQTMDFSGGLVGLQSVVSTAGTLIFNSTISTPGAGLDIGGGATVIFNKPLMGMDRISVFGNTVAQFNATVSTSITFGHSTVIIRSATELPGAEISEGGILKLASDVTLNGRLNLVNDGFTLGSTAPIVNTNGFNLEVTDGLKDGGPEADPLPAKLIKTGVGILTVGGDNTLDGWSGGTTILEGTVKAGSSTAFKSSTSFTLANSAGAILDLDGKNFTLGELNGGGDTGGTVELGTGTLTLHSATSSRFDGKIEGEGSLVKTGEEVLWLTGANSYSGTTTVNAGVLKGNARGLQGHILNNASVVFDQTGEGTYAGQMSGTGTLEKTGAGTLTVTQANTFDGGMTLTAGTLVVAHSDALGAGDVSVHGGILKSDGGSPRQINMGGDFTHAGGILELSLYGAGENDRLLVTGSSLLESTLSLRVHPGFLPVGITTYSLLNASSLSGMFTLPQNGASLRFDLSYSSASALLTATKSPYASFTQTSNQNSVGGYLDSLYPTATGDLGLVMGELNALSATDLSNALRSISPQPYQTVTTMGRINLTGFSQRIFSQLARTRAGHRGVQTTGFDQNQTNARWGSLTAEAGDEG
jgi:fibronectin-binding autotransporter adhesin